MERCHDRFPGGCGKADSAGEGTALTESRKRSMLIWKVWKNIYRDR